MKPSNSDIDFLISEKKRLSNGQVSLADPSVLDEGLELKFDINDSFVADKTSELVGDSQCLLEPEESQPEEYLAKKASQKPEPVLKKEKPRPQPQKIPKRKVLKTSISFSSLFESSSLVGLDIGSRSVKYVQLKKIAGALKIINFGNYPVPDTSIDSEEKGKEQILSKILQENFNNRSFKITLLTSAVSGLKVLYKNIQVPKAARKELAKAVPWACRKDLPFPVESTVFEYQLVDKKNKSDDKLDVFVVAAQKDLVFNHVKALQNAQISPTKVSTIPVALWKLYRTIFRKETQKCVGLIDIGANTSHIVFVKQGQLEFAREISTGCADFTEALTGAIFVAGHEINLDAKQAESIQREYGFPDEVKDKSTKEGVPLKEVAALLGPVFERLVSGIQRTIDFFKEKLQVDAVEKIYLTGGGALMTNLIPRLSKELNIEIDLLNPFELFTFKKFKNKPELRSMGPRFAVAVGLALDTQKAFNLLPQQLKGSYTFQYLKRIFRYGFVIAILLMVLLSQNVSRQFKKIKNEFKRINSEYALVKPRRDKFLELQNELKKLNAVRRVYSASLDINLAAANHLKAISYLIPRNITLTSFRISYEKRKVKGSENEYATIELLLLTGVAFETNSMEGINLAKFLLDLEKSEYFYKISLKSQRIREDGGLEFTIECET